MSLEPTEEQERRIADLLLSCGSTRGCEMSDAGRVWELVRDMVLEAAAKACRECPGSGETNCEQAIRAMKGNP